jgi:hypothetical protein
VIISPLPKPRVFGSADHSADAIPRFHLADISRIQITKEDRYHLVMLRTNGAKLTKVGVNMFGLITNRGQDRHLRVETGYASSYPQII